MLPMSLSIRFSSCILQPFDIIPKLNVRFYTNKMCPTFRAVFLKRVILLQVTMVSVSLEDVKILSEADGYALG